jgi:hypothetical protein
MLNSARPYSKTSILRTPAQANPYRLAILTVPQKKYSVPHLNTTDVNSLPFKYLADTNDY